jgi:hypothetical protein
MKYVKEHQNPVWLYKGRAKTNGEAPLMLRIT